MARYRLWITLWLIGGLCCGLVSIPPAWAIRWKVGPTYRPPTVEAPPDWGPLQAGISMEEPFIAWWQQLNDPQLNQLILDAIHHNYDLQAALARIRDARSQEKAAIGRLLPTISAGGIYTRVRFSDNGLNPLGRFAEIGTQSPPNSPFKEITITNPTNDYRLELDASWELDIFGANRWHLEASRVRIGASIEANRSVMMTLLADVARNYVELRQAQHRLAIAREGIALQEKTVTLTQERYDIGLAPQQDATKAMTELETLRSTLPPLEASAEISIHALGVLTGRDPNALLTELSTIRPVPEAPLVMPLGLPATLVARRPDIRQAALELEAASDDIASARARLYPDISLIAGGGGFGVGNNFGWESLKIGDLFKWSSRFWGVSPSISWQIFQRMELHATVDSARARYMEKEAQLRQSILEALQDVQDAISNMEAARKQQDALKSALSQNQQTVEQVTTLYDVGLNNQLALLEAQRTLNTLQDRLAQSEAETTLQTIRLYKALGGGWEAF